MSDTAMRSQSVISNNTNPLAAKSDATVAYTDGACKGNPGAGGWGAHLIFSDGKTEDLYGGESATTNNRMELMGAIQALIHSPCSIKLEIWTDSSYVKKGITEWIEGWKSRGWKTASKKPVANQDLWQQLDEQCQGRDVVWYWVKGHAGHAGNEKADELANLGVHSESGKKKEHIMSNNTKNMANDDWLTRDPLGLDDADHADFVEGLHHSDTETNSSHSEQNVTETAADVPVFDGDTSRANPHFQPLLPKPIHRAEPNRQLIMDTETTGLDPLKGDRIIEVGIVEMVGRKFTGEKLHVYINPQRGMDEVVIRIHGISEAFLQDKPTFDQVAQSLYEFMDGAEIIAHNASFDMGFLSMEFDRVGMTDFAQRVHVTDSLMMAKQQYPGQKNTLDALVRRLNVGKQDRTFHGALLDSEILAEVYLAMTGGQVSLAIEEDGQSDNGQTTHMHFANLASLLIASDSDKDENEKWFASLMESYPELSHSQHS